MQLLQQSSGTTASRQSKSEEKRTRGLPSSQESTLRKSTNRDSTWQNQAGITQNAPYCLTPRTGHCPKRKTPFFSVIFRQPVVNRCNSNQFLPLTKPKTKQGDAFNPGFVMPIAILRWCDPPYRMKVFPRHQCGSRRPHSRTIHGRCAWILPHQQMRDVPLQTNCPEISQNQGIGTMINHLRGAS